MLKLKLNVEKLAVESFETALTGQRQGTVHGAGNQPPAQGLPAPTEPQLTDIDYTNCTCITWCGQFQCDSMQRTCTC